MVSVSNVLSQILEPWLPTTRGNDLVAEQTNYLTFIDVVLMRSLYFVNIEVTEPFTKQSIRNNRQEKKKQKKKKRSYRSVCSKQRLRAILEIMRLWWAGAFSRNFLFAIAKRSVRDLYPKDSRKDLILFQRWYLKMNRRASLTAVLHSCICLAGYSLTAQPYVKIGIQFEYSSWSKTSSLGFFTALRMEFEAR